MAAKKKTSKTDFVRKYPDLPAADVVTKGEEAGLKFSDKYVYKVRAVDRSKSKKGPAAPKAPRGAKASMAPGAGPTGKRSTPTTSDFVKSLPPKMSFKEAAERATALGIKLSKGYFYVLKSGAKKAPGGLPKAGAVGRGRPAGVMNGMKGLRLTSDNPSEQALIDSVRSIGAGRARALIDSVEKFERA